MTAIIDGVMVTGDVDEIYLLIQKSNAKITTGTSTTGYIGPPYPTQGAPVIFTSPKSTPPKPKSRKKK